MDKQLIFCYRRRTDHVETGDADRPHAPVCAVPSYEGVVLGEVGAGPEPAVGKRVNRGDAGR